MKDEKIVVLKGDIRILISNRFALNYIKNYLTKDINDDRIKISIGEKNPEEIFSDVTEILKKYGIEEQINKGAEKVLFDFQIEENNFREFSVKALDIRNNNCNHDEFNEFTISLKKNMKNRSLYELQLLSAYHVAFSQNACNFSVPGAGKTSIVYGAYTYLKNLSDDDIKKVDKLLIIGPLSSFGPWEIEYEECFGRKPAVKRLISGISKQEKIDYLYSRYSSEITLISYASLSSVTDAISWFLKTNKVMVVLDEAHKIKNTNGGIMAQSVMAIAQYCKSRVALTGTPAPNGYEDLYNLFKFIWPNKNIMEFKLNQLKDMSFRENDVRVPKLVEAIAPYYIRIKKSDLDIPPAITNPPVLVEMGEYQRKIYDFIEKKYIDSIIENSENDLSNKFKAQIVGAKMIRLMQAASNPNLLKLPLANFYKYEDISLEEVGNISDSDILKEIMEYQKNEIPKKFVKTKELVDRILAEEGKVVIWACFVQTILELKQYLESNGILCQELYGAIPVDKNSEEDDESIELTREKIVALFQEQNCPFKVIIANPFAVAESISLHKACHNAIYLERTFNAAHFIQSKDRIHRYGLAKDVTTNYYYILSQDSIDEVIDDRLAVKESRMMKIMETMPIPLFDNVSEDFGDEDMKAMIRNYVTRTKKI